MSDKNEKLNKFLAKKEVLREKYKDDDPFVDEVDMSIGRLSSGSFMLDKALGGGWPLGRFGELYGAYSSGKSTIATTTAAECVKLGEPVLYLDYENSFMPPYARTLGLDTDSPLFQLVQPRNLEEGADLTEAFLEDDTLGLVILDSLAAAPPKSYLEGEIGDEGRVAQLARLLAQRVLPRFTDKLRSSNAMMLILNQNRANLQIMSRASVGDTPGGFAMKFYASVRVELKKVQSIKGKTESLVSGKQEETVVASKIQARVIKNKTAPPFQEAYFWLRNGFGLSEYDAVMEYGSTRGIIHKGGAGSWTVPAFGNYQELKIRGAEKLIDYLAADPEYFGLIRQACINHLNETPLIASLPDDETLEEL